MKKLIVLLLLAPFLGSTQSYDPLSAPNTYASKGNPNYWKNKQVHAAYWQQDVHYTIDVKLDLNEDKLEGTERLIYTNNSPFELKELFFHLYQNAFQPGSYYDDLQKNNGRKNVYGKNESQLLGTQVEGLTVDGQSVKTELDNTVLKVMLNKPIPAGAQVKIDLKFKTWFDADGNVRRRMKVFDSFGSKHYDGVHWYPRIAVFDAKFGWTTDQHLGREFYGDFGCFDVNLTLPSNYVLDGTGFLTNRNEVYPPELRKKLDVKNFATKPWNEAPSVITPFVEGSFKTWKFHAENVHDFAWTADPNYRIGEAEWNGIKCYSLVQEPHAAGWQNAASYVAKIIKTFSEDFGMYTYHKMIAADARDGMEYPMLTLDGGYDPGYRGLFVHEIGHNWFFGQVGNNETYRASMDEGFTQFLTAWGLEAIDGDTIFSYPSKSWYHQKFRKPQLARETRVYYGYIRDALVFQDAVLNTHSDGFGGALRHGGGYGHVYYKTATMLYNMQYVLGDSLFLAAMQNYFQEWKIAHPYFEDFRNSIIQFTGVDLNWFFDQWFTTTKRIDYGIKKVKKGDSDGAYEVTFKRKGRMQMPLDFSAYDENGEEYKYHIPNGWFAKETDAKVLDRWIGWDKLKPTYTAKIKIDSTSKLDLIQIDPSNRLADVNQLDNRTNQKMRFRFDHRLQNTADRDAYEIFGRPDFWYNGFDGLKAGVHFEGDYFDKLHFIDFSWWYNTMMLENTNEYTGLLRGNNDIYSYRLKYSTPLLNVMEGLDFGLGSKFLDGYFENKIWFKKSTKSNKSSITLGFKTMYRPDAESLGYLILPTEWNADQWNNSLNVGLRHKYKYKYGSGEIKLGLRSSSLLSDYNYSYASLEVINRNKWKKLDWKTRFFAQYGAGDRWAPESQLFLAGANPEEMMDNKYMRSVGFTPNSWTGIGSDLGHFQYGGGLNIRAFAGYLAPSENEDGLVRASYAGFSGASFSGELDFNRLIGWKPRKLSRSLHLATYLFGDAGIINLNEAYESFELADLRADAGLGLALTVKRFWKLEKVKPLVIRADFPLVVNRIPATESQYVGFRWLLGIERSF